VATVGANVGIPREHGSGHSLSMAITSGTTGIAGRPGSPFVAQPVEIFIRQGKTSAIERRVMVEPLDDAAECGERGLIERDA
jgi:hypothetical protein